MIEFVFFTNYMISNIFRVNIFNDNNAEYEYSFLPDFIASCLSRVTFPSNLEALFELYSPNQT